MISIVFCSKEMYLRSISTNRADIDHSFAEFHERSSTVKKCTPSGIIMNIANSPFDRKIEVCNVMKNKVDEWFITFFSKEINEGL